MPPTAPHEITIEKTPSYFITPSAPRRIKNTIPDVKIILVFKDPVVRVISDYTQILSKHRNPKSFHDFAFTNIKSKRNHSKKVQNQGNKLYKDLRVNYSGDDDVLTKNFSLFKKEKIKLGETIAKMFAINTSWRVIDIGLYYKHLKRWLKVFNRSDIFFASGENLIADPASELQKVERFLNLTPYIKREHFALDPKKGFLCPLVNITDNGTTATTASTLRPPDSQTTTDVNLQQPYTIVHYNLNLSHTRPRKSLPYQLRWLPRRQLQQLELQMQINQQREQWQELRKQQQLQQQQQQKPQLRTRCLGKTKGRVHPKIQPFNLYKISSFYHPFNLIFYQATGVNFNWTTPDDYLPELDRTQS